jgi:hypothetical protein
MSPRRLALLSLHAALALVLCSEAANTQSAWGPAHDARFDFAPSLAKAVEQAKGKQKIVVYSVFTTSVRDNHNWVQREHQIWNAPGFSALLRGRPMVALVPGKGSHKSLKLPQLGFAILDPSGKTVLGTIDVSSGTTERILSMLRSELGAGDDDSGIEKEAPPQRPSIGDLANARIVLHREQSKPYYTKLPPDVPTRQQLVVVSDAAGFLEALTHWEKDAIFPILFMDTRFLPKFAHAFGPQKIWVQKSSRGKARRGAGQLGAGQLLAAWAQACGLDDAPADEAAALRAWKQLEVRSPGIVLSDPEDPMALAGLALAAGRRQALGFVPRFDKPAKLVERDVVLELRSAITQKLAAAQIQALDLYDELDYVTLACAQPYRYRDLRYADKTPYATDDFLARRDDELRWGYVGRLHGDRVRAVYQAMCALFLDPQESLLFSRYSKSSQPWKTYDTAGAAQLLAKDFEVTEISHPKATRAAWHELFAAQDGRWGLVHVNSSGGARDWSTSKGKANFDDIFETLPAIVSYTHSGSAAAPYSLDSIAGRWLERGAYVYFGSCSEPYLDAFVPIDRVYRQALELGMPLGAAFRWPVGMRRWRPWKLAYFGDPLRRLGIARAKPLAPHSDGMRRFGPELHYAGRKNPFGHDRQLRTIEEMVMPILAGEDPPSLRSMESKLRRVSSQKSGSPIGVAWADAIALVIRAQDLDADVHKLVARAHELGLESRELMLALHDRGRRLARAASKAKDAKAFEAAFELLLFAKAPDALQQQASTLLSTWLGATKLSAKETKAIQQRLQGHPAAERNKKLLSVLK